MSTQHFILDDILSSEELPLIYHELLKCESWSLANTTVSQGKTNIPFSSFPALHIESSSRVQVRCLSDYFRSVIIRIKSRLRKEHGIKLPSHIKRIHVGAKSSMTKSSFHINSRSKEDWTVPGFLNPIWDAADGGVSYLSDHKIENRSGRYIVFPSSVKQGGGCVSNEKLSYWRIAVNMIPSP